MSYYQIIKHYQAILNQLGDPVRLEPAGQQAMAEGGQMSIALKEVVVKKQNLSGLILSPFPAYKHDLQDSYRLNRIRISANLADDYSKGFPLKDEELKSILFSKKDLFGFY